MGLGQILGNILKSTAEYNAGVIRHISNGWIFSDKGTTNRNGVNLPPRPDMLGRPMSLKLGQKTVCNCPNTAFSILYPKTTHGFQTPYRECQRCKYHLKRIRGRPLPCCSLLREIRKNSPTPAEVTTGMLEGAVKKAKEFLDK